MPKLRFGDYNCIVEGDPKFYIERAQRRHFSNFNRSEIDFSSPPLFVPRGYMIDRMRRTEKRHYCIHTAKSYLDDYY
ncbi:hypothetical protein Trydic_g155 [Trypoxylus dichotomus]